MPNPFDFPTDNQHFTADGLDFDSVFPLLDEMLWTDEDIGNIEATSETLFHQPTENSMACSNTTNAILSNNQGLNTPNAHHMQPSYTSQLYPQPPVCAQSANFTNNQYGINNHINQLVAPTQNPAQTTLGFDGMQYMIGANCQAGQIQQAGQMNTHFNGTWNAAHIQPKPPQVHQNFGTPLYLPQQPAFYHHLPVYTPAAAGYNPIQHSHWQQQSPGFPVSGQMPQHSQTLKNQMMQQSHFRQPTPSLPMPTLTGLIQPTQLGNHQGVRSFPNPARPHVDPPRKQRRGLHKYGEFAPWGPAESPLQFIAAIDRKRFDEGEASLSESQLHWYYKGRELLDRINARAPTVQQPQLVQPSLQPVQLNQQLLSRAGLQGQRGVLATTDTVSPLRSDDNEVQLFSSYAAPMVPAMTSQHFQPQPTSTLQRDEATEINAGSEFFHARNYLKNFRPVDEASSSTPPALIHNTESIDLTGDDDEATQVLQGSMPPQAVDPIDLNTTGPVASNSTFGALPTPAGSSTSPESGPKPGPELEVTNSIETTSVIEGKKRKRSEERQARSKRVAIGDSEPFEPVHTELIDITGDDDVVPPVPQASMLPLTVDPRELTVTNHAESSSTFAGSPTPAASSTSPEYVPEPEVPNGSQATSGTNGKKQKRSEECQARTKRPATREFRPYERVSLEVRHQMLMTGGSRKWQKSWMKPKTSTFDDPTPTSTTPRRAKSKRAQLDTRNHIKATIESSLFGKPGRYGNTGQVTDPGMRRHLLEQLEGIRQAEREEAADDPSTASQSESSTTPQPQQPKPKAKPTSVVPASLGLKRAGTRRSGHMDKFKTPTSAPTAFEFAGLKTNKQRQEADAASGAEEHSQPLDDSTPGRIDAKNGFDVASAADMEKRSGHDGDDDLEAAPSAELDNDVETAAQTDSGDELEAALHAELFDTIETEQSASGLADKNEESEFLGLFEESVLQQTYALSQAFHTGEQTEESEEE